LVNHTIAALTNLKKYEDNKPTEINKWLIGVMRARRVFRLMVQSQMKQ
jgi:hypothetical protein